MGFGNSKKKETEVQPPPDKKEIKSIFQICSKKLTLFRNKKIHTLKKTKNEIIKNLQENNLDYAKCRMESYIRDEDYITVCDIVGPYLEILEERFIYIDSSTECPADLRKQLDGVIYAASHLEIEDFVKLKDIIKRKYGLNYITKAENNVDKFIDEFLVEKLQVKIVSESSLMMRLRQLSYENNINFNFSNECNVPGELVQSIGNFNPYGSINPYGQPSNVNYNQQQNNLPPQDNGNPYGPPPDNGNPYGPPPDNGNPYGPPPDNVNPYGPPPENNNPFPKAEDHNQGGKSN